MARGFVRLSGQVSLRNNSRAVLVLFIASAMWVQPVRAQSQDNRQQEIQQLKDKLEQLDQMMRDAKDQLDALEAERPPAGAPPATRPGTVAATPAGSTQVTVVAVPTEKVLASAQGGDLVPLEGEITEPLNSISVYGFAMLDSGYNFGQIDPNWYDVVRPTKLASYPDQWAPNGMVYAGVRQSRLGIKSNSPTPLGNLSTIFEFELFGTGVDAGQTTFRLRHAYGELGKVGAGQTWSPFMDIGIFPDSIEYWGPSGMAFFRNVQVRWMPVRGERTNVTVALEKPGGSGDQGLYSDRIELSNIRPRFNWPDLSGNVRFNGNWGYLQTAAIVRSIGWLDAGNNQYSGSAVGWGINLTSNIKLGQKSVAKLGYVYGHGIENYMNDAPVDIGIAYNGTPVVNPPEGAPLPIHGVALPVTGVVAFVDHSWSKHYTSSVGYSLVNISNSNAQKPSDFHQGSYALGNLLYRPIPKVMMGTEFQFGRRVNFSDGFNTNDYRVQFSFKYDWDKMWKFPSM